MEIVVISEADKEGIINKILERKNELIRPKVVNIDQAVLCFTENSPDINLDLLDRLIVLCESKNIDIIICINKIDIADKNKVEEIKTAYEKIGYKVVLASAQEQKGISQLEELLTDRVSVFAGLSGVGKSSLINEIIPTANMEIGDISAKNKKGKHTTRHTQLFKGDKGTYIVDSPGFTSLFFENIKEIKADNLGFYFKEFEPYLDDCKFGNCSHISEPSCAVREQVGTTIDKNRFDRYSSLLKELN